jgi:hypothetical protein
MLTKNEIMTLVELSNLNPAMSEVVNTILRNYEENDLVSFEKLEVICQLIIKK